MVDPAHQYLTWQTRGRFPSPVGGEMLPPWDDHGVRARPGVTAAESDGRPLFFRTPGNNVENALWEHDPWATRNAKWDHLLPSGSAADWRAHGAALGRALAQTGLADDYPAPPYVAICDNGEAQRMKWDQNPWRDNFQDSWTIGEFVRGFGDLRRALMDGFKDAAPHNWRDRILFAPYDNRRDWIEATRAGFRGPTEAYGYDRTILSAYPGDRGPWDALSPDDTDHVWPIFGSWTPQGGSVAPTLSYLAWCRDIVARHRPRVVLWFDSWSATDHSHELGALLAADWADTAETPPPRPPAPHVDVDDLLGNVWAKGAMIQQDATEAIRAYRHGQRAVVRQELEDIERRALRVLQHVETVKEAIARG